MNRRRVVRWLLLALMATGLAATATWRLWPVACGEGDVRLPASRVTAPLPGDPGDPRLQRLVEAVESWGRGKVVWSLGYDHNRFVEFAGFSDALGVWRRGDPVFVMTDAASGRPLWGLRQAEQRRTWDASAQRLVSVGVPAGKSPEISVRRLEDGRQVWCERAPETAVKADDPISTAVQENQDVLFLAGKVGSQRLTNFRGSDGTVRWTRPLHGIDRGDFIGTSQRGMLVVGGRPPYELREPASRDAVVLTGLDATSGHTRWTHRVPAGTTASAFGDDGGVVVTLQRGAATELVALDERTGQLLWRQALGTKDQDAAVRGGVVLVRTETQLTGHDLATGKLLWRKAIRQQPQRFPYGFRLAEQPMWSEREVLLAATDALIPTGWALATNTGAVLVRD